MRQVIQMAAGLAALLVAPIWAATGVMTPALAQTTQAPFQAPQDPAVDIHGVDVINGLATSPNEILSVGTSENGLNRNIFLNVDAYQGYAAVKKVSTGVLRLFVNVGGETDAFVPGANNTFSPWKQRGQSLIFVPQNGSTTSGILTYTKGDGTIVVYSYNIPNGGSIQSIQKPDGEIIRFYYGPSAGVMQGNYVGIMPTGVVSNKGWMLKYDYAIKSDGSSYLARVTALNTATEPNYCDPMSNGCVYAESWPYLTYSFSPACTNINSCQSSNVSVTDALGRTISILGSHLPSGMVDGPTAIDQWQRVTRFVVGAQTWTYSYSDTQQRQQFPNSAPDPYITTVTDGNGNSRTYSVSPSNAQVYNGYDKNGAQLQYSYDYTTGGISKILYPEGEYEQYVRDARGNITQSTKVAKPNSGLSNIVETANYDTTCAIQVKCNKPNYVIDARGNRTDYTYDPVHGGVLTVTGPAASNGVRPQTRYTYSQLPSYSRNSSGAVVQSGLIWKLTSVSTCQTQAGAACVGTADEVRTTTVYGTPNLLPTSVTKAAGDGSVSTTTTMTYDDVGNLLTVTDPLGNTTRYRYDVMREKVGEVGPDPDGSGPLLPRATRTSYTVDGLVQTVETGTVNSQSDADWANFNSLQQTTTVYDSSDRPAQTTLTAGGSTVSVTQTAYDAGGRVICTAVRMNPSQFASLPASACTLGTAGSYGQDRITYTTYDALDRVTKVTTAYGTTSQRDLATNGYDSQDGVLLTEQDADGNLTTHVYDGYNRLIQTQYPSPTPGAHTSNANDYEGFGYDANDNIVSHRRRDGQTVSITFDALNRSVTDLLGASYVYDNLGRVTSVSLNGQTVSSVYDALGRKVQETGAIGTVLLYQYDAAGQRTRLTYSDGFYISYGYDNTHALTTINDNTGFRLATYAYDNLGRRGSLTLGNGAQTVYSYDAFSRLTNLAINNPSGQNQALGFGYNPAHQVVSRSASNDAYAYRGPNNIYAAASNAYSLNGLNQIAVSGSASFSYDGRGNLTGDASNSYGYDIANRMTSVSGAVGSPTLAYDPVGRLFQTLGSTRTWFVYDGSQILEEYSGPGAVTADYVYGPGGDEPLVWYDRVHGARYWLQANQQGSVVAVTADNGSVAALNSYDEYGLPGPGNLGRFQYTGQAWIPEIRMYDYKARVYSPNLGRFMQTDPAGYKDGLNWYGYVHGDPVNGSDPSGTAGCDSSLSAAQCSTLMADQTKTISAVQAAQADLTNLQSERAAVAAGTQTSLSSNAQATEAELVKVFDSSSASTVSALQKNLSNVMTFLTDPGTAAGGKYDYRVADSADISGAGGKPFSGAWNPSKPNTIAIDFNHYNSSNSMITLSHEPNHVFGLNGTEFYGTSAYTEAKKQGGTGRMLRNADSVACFANPRYWECQ